MNRTTHEIQSAINACEIVSKPTSFASTPVTITQEQLCILIEASKEHLSLNAKERIERMEGAVHEALEALRSAFRT